MKEDMRGLFFIVKGQYKKDGDSFKNPVTGEKMYIGGYDPESENTSEWYMVLDTKTFHCVSCGSTLKKVLDGVRSVIIRYKGESKLYFRHVSKVTSDDYYETHYLGHKELTPDKRAKKAQGRCPRVSPAMRCLYEKLLEEYGDYFSEEVERMEDTAYETLKENTPLKKSKRLVSKTKKTLNKKVLNTSGREDKVLDTTHKKTIKPRKKFGLKKLSMV